MTLIDNSITPISFQPCNIDNNLIVGTNSLIFRNIGTYCIRGEMNVINQSTVDTSFQIFLNVLSGMGTTNPAFVTYGGVKSNIELRDKFYFMVTISVPNTTLQISVRSLNPPTLLTCGKLKITRKN